MPNYCANLLQITGVEEDIKAFKEKAGSNPNNPFLSFEAFISCPNSDTDDGWNVIDWRIAHWGTKWDALYTTLVVDTPDQLVYRFDTAWSPPERWLSEMEKQYPRLVFEHLYAEPGVDFAGLSIYNVPLQSYYDVQMPSVSTIVNDYIYKYEG